MASYSTSIILLRPQASIRLRLPCDLLRLCDVFASCGQVLAWLPYSPARCYDYEASLYDVTNLCSTVHKAIIGTDKGEDQTRYLCDCSLWITIPLYLPHKAPNSICRSLAFDLARVPASRHLEDYLSVEILNSVAVLHTLLISTAQPLSPDQRSPSITSTSIAPVPTTHRVMSQPIFVGDPGDMVQVQNSPVAVPRSMALRMMKEFSLSETHSLSSTARPLFEL